MHGSSACLTYAHSCISSQPAVSGLALLSMGRLAIGWGKKGDQAECLSSSQSLFWACSHGSELQGVQEQQERKLAGSGLAQHCFHQTRWSEQVTGPAQIHGAEKKALCIDARSLQSIVAAFAIPCFLILSFNSDFLFPTSVLSSGFSGPSLWNGSTITWRVASNALAAPRS